MKTLNTLLLLIIITGFIGCKKEAVKVIPTVTIATVTNITAITAKCGGEITSDGGTAVLAQGICWSLTNPTPTIENGNVQNGAGSGSFTITLSGLTPGATYYLRAYATNSVGTAYSSQVTFKTLALLPVVSTTTPAAIKSTSAISGGNITNDGGAPVTKRGVCWAELTKLLQSDLNLSTADNKTTDGTGSGSFTSSITGLNPCTYYILRSYATNSIGTAYGVSEIFATDCIFPLIFTTTPTTITATTAISGGDIDITGRLGVTIVTARGVCWSTAHNPTTANNKTMNGTGSGTFVSNLSGLSANTIYYLRAYATNSAGTCYGEEVSFKTSVSGSETVADIDGNVYNTVTIGTQVWMVENLKTTKYRNGDPIPNITDNATWGALATCAYCWNNNDAATYKATYGALYNWYAVADSRNIAPSGWHVPTDAECIILTTYLGGERVAGGKLKEAGTAHWNIPNTGATNSSGFTALPGGYRYNGGTFYSFGKYGYWWSKSSTTYDECCAWERDLFYNIADVTRGITDKRNGFSVRCVKD